jgi:hypothetical protein
MSGLLFNMKKILVALAIASLFSCSPGTKEIHVNNRYYITLPSEMKAVAGLNAQASLQQADESIPLYAVVVDESKEDMVKHDLDYDLDLYFNNIVSRNLIESLSEVSIAEPVKEIIGGSPAYLLDVTGKAGAESIYYKLAIIETSSAFYQVMLWTTASKREELQPQMEEMARSFREK